MEPHSTVEAPQKESSSLLLHVLSSIIALVTLALPLYITAHYSSSTAADSIPTISPASPSTRSIARVSEGAK
jgi:flagellar basal body-associated protein FliL